MVDGALALNCAAKDRVVEFVGEPVSRLKDWVGWFVAESITFTTLLPPPKMQLVVSRLQNRQKAESRYSGLICNKLLNLAI